ncbi:hypothetical protein [Mucilaginibacter sp.]|nr:hypothetical protein [Mucilaginibacter sp.]MDR3696434.1 hypothetical protein [Mucilaginibacter sp.]
MEIKLEIPEYDNTKGFRFHRENGFEIKVVGAGNNATIMANK